MIHLDSESCIREGETSEVDQQACIGTTVAERLSKECPYRYYFKDIDVDFRGGVLILHGRVPTFYMKQILQTRLRDIDGVARIDNQVDVVSSNGLSSIRPR